MVRKPKDQKGGFFFMFLSLSTLVIVLIVVLFSFLTPKKVIKSSAAGKCVDSDGGYDPFVKGTIAGPNLTTGADPVDYCITDSYRGEMVVEYGCSDEDGWLYGSPPLFSNSVACQSLGDGPACVGGACVYNIVDPDFYCEKDDGGDIYTKGHLLSDVTGVYIPAAGSYLSDIYDFCIDNEKLMEYSCFRPEAHASSFGSSNAVFSNSVICPNGCSDGMCVKASPPKKGK